MKERIKAILSDIGRGVYEKDEELLLSLLAALAGESILLLGPPGIAKSMIARRIKYAFRDARSFDYLMSRFSTTDEVFGPVSISRLKTSDSYERSIDGYLPTADVAFLDEIWKAGPAIQNTLLTVINEKLFRNGNKELRLPLKILIGASNELPAQGEGLEALWDRFIIRVVCKPISDEKNFRKMLLGSDENNIAESDLAISEEEYAKWQKEIKDVTVTEDVLQVITEIRRQLHSVKIKDSSVQRDIYVSDRRWKKIVMLLKASAFMHDRTQTDVSDVFVAHHCLWNNPEEYDDLKQIVMKAMGAAITEKIGRMRQMLNSDLRATNVNQAIKEIEKTGQDTELKIYDKYYYYVVNHGTGNTYIFLADLRRMTIYTPEQIKHMVTPLQGIMYHPANEPWRTVIRLLDKVGYDTAAEKELESVNLYRDDTHLYINGVRYDIDMLAPGEEQTAMNKTKAVSQIDYPSEIESLATEITVLEHQLANNMFISSDDRRGIEHYLASVKKSIALMRVDVEKLFV